MQPTQYDPGILQQFADGLYKQAQSIVFRTALRYGFTSSMATGVLFLVLLVPFSSNLRPDELDRLTTFAVGVVIAVTLFAILAGVDAGRKKAFGLKLQAQQLLCQRQIEQNTRQDKAFSATQAS